MNVAWNIESGDCRECRKGRMTHPRVPTPAGARMDPRRPQRRASLAASWDSSRASPYLHTRASASPRSAPTCPAIPTRTSHRPSCTATGCDFHVRSAPGMVSTWRNLWCKFCNRQRRRWSEDLTCWNCLRGSIGRGRFRRASSAQSGNLEILTKIFYCFTRFNYWMLGFEPSILTFVNFFEIFLSLRSLHNYFNFKRFAFESFQQNLHLKQFSHLSSLQLLLIVIVSHQLDGFVVRASRNQIAVRWPRHAVDRSLVVLGSFE